MDATIRRKRKSELIIKPKNNGPSPAYGIEVHVDFRRQLKIKRTRVNGGHHCDVQGTFVRCYMGDFTNHQRGVIKIRAKGKRKGTWISRARVYSQGLEDPNSGNGRVSMTIGVKGRRRWLSARYRRPAATGAGMGRTAHCLSRLGM